MENVVLIIHLLLALALIGVVLLQRSDVCFWDWSNSRESDL